MTKKMLIDAANPEEVRVCVLEKKRVEDFDFESSSRKPLRGNIYLARVTRVEPSLQAAFVEYGGNRHGFLAFSEIHPDYYQIPVSDRQAIQEAEAEEAALASKLNLAARDDEDDEDTGDDDQIVDVSDDEVHDDIAPDDLPVAETTPKSNAPVAADSEIEHDANRDAIDHDTETDEHGSQAENVEEEEEEEDGDEEDDADNEDAPSASDAADDEIAGQDTSAAETVKLPDDDTAPDDRDIDRNENDSVYEDETTLVDSESDATSLEDDENDDNATGDVEELDPNSHAVLLEQFKEARRKRMKLIRNYKIQEVIKRRQILLIQVVKEERGNKGAALTTYLSLAGRYCVLMPNTARGGGISRKIPNASDRKRLRRVVDTLDVSGGMGLIIRTAGAKRTKAEIKRDYDYLTRLWENIRSLTLKSVAPCIIYEEASLIKRAIRDLYDKDIDKILVEGEAGYREAKDFMKMLMPSHAKNVQPYKDPAPLFLKYGAENQLDAMYQPTVRLKSGGYIVINQTEALIAIDVNSGKATRERNIERTALATNIEAAVETARQCRLRDLAGLLVIDFIDMEEHKNNRTVEKKFKEALKADRARIQVGRISSFGLLEMSRQRRRSGIVDGTTQTCPTCNGAGAVRSVEMAALRILRGAEAEAVQSRESVLTIHVANDVALYILNHKRNWLKRIEEAYDLSVEILGDPKRSGDQFDIEKSGPARELRKKTTHINADLSSTEIDDPIEDGKAVSASDETGAGEEDEEKPRKRRRRRRRKKNDTEDTAIESEASDKASEPEAEAETAPADENDASSDDEEDKPKRRRRRGRRGGRRNPRSKDGDEQVDAQRLDAEFPDTPSGSAHEASSETASDTPSNKDRRPDRPQRASADGSAATERAPKQTTPAQSSDETQPLPDDVADAGTVIGDLSKDEESVPVPKNDTGDGVKVKRKSRKGWWQRAIGS